MEAILQFLKQYEIWIYVLLGAVGVIYLRKLLLAWQEWRNSTFGIERDIAQRRFASALTMVVLVSLMGLAELVLVSFITPALPLAALATPTVDLLATPTVTLAPQATVDLAATTEITPAVGVEVASTQVVEERLDGCIPGVIEWTYPTEGEQISGAVELKGTVVLPNLGFYKYEYSSPGSGVWTTIAAGNEIKVDQPLGGLWNTEQLTPGDYQLRLVVSDNANQALTPCGISVQVILP